MGACCASDIRNARVVFLGLDNAGKSSILSALALSSEQSVNTAPTIGYQKLNITRYKFQLEIYDVGGDSKGRDLWRHYIKGAHAIVFVVDSANHRTIDEGQESAKSELHRIIKNDELPFTAPLLVFANKQDMNAALLQSDIIDRLDLKSVVSRPWHVQQSCAITCQGIDDGLEWLCSALSTQRKEARKSNK